MTAVVNDLESPRESLDIQPESSPASHAIRPQTQTRAKTTSRGESIVESIARLARTGEGRMILIGGLACVGVTAAIFESNIRHFVFVWSTDENYSHGFLVPLLSLYFANEAARRGPIAPRSGVALGVSLIGASVLGKLATIVVPIGIVSDLSLPIGLAGVCSLLLGIDGLKRFGFAIGFLAFMIPLPIALYTKIAAPLQLLVSESASVLLGAIGIPVLREGNLMTLPGGTKMFVAEACSGMRQLTGFLALTCAIAYYSGRSIWYRSFLMITSIPVAMIANIVRVVITGVIMHRIDPRYASGSWHTAEGLFMLAFGLWLLWSERLVVDALIGMLLPSSNAVEKGVRVHTVAS